MLVTAAMRAAQGTELERMTSHPIDASAVRRWRIAVEWPEPVSPRLSADVAPLDFNPFAWTVADRTRQSDAGGDIVVGLELSLGLEPPPVTTVLNGGLALRYGSRPMRVGDVITATSRLLDYAEREATRGPLLLTRISSTWTDQDGHFVKEQTMTTVRF